MRTEIDKNVTFEYADEIGFAFMPCVLRASGSNLASLKLEIDCGSYSKAYTVDAINEKVAMDYREFIQGAFDGLISAGVDWTVAYDMDNLSKFFSLDAYAIDSSGNTIAEIAWNTTYIWGAVNPRETWNGFKRLTWFTNFPFSFGLFVSKSGTNVLIGYEGAPQKLMKVSTVGMIDFNSKELPAGARYSIIYDYDGEIKQATFDNYFDLTFYLNTGGKQSKLLRIDYDNTESGIYLRWIDRHGFIRYWLFTPVDETRAVSTDGEFVRNNLLAWSDLYGYVGANGRRQGYSREDTITICAPSVDQDTFDMLQDLTTSPVVDMYLGGDWKAEKDRWQSVTIKAGSYTKTSACLQDFACALVLNDTNIQKL